MSVRFTSAVGLFIVSLLLVASARAQVRLPKLISDGMVLQRDAPLKIWGWAGPGEKITVQFNNKNYKTVTGRQRQVAGYAASHAGRRPVYDGHCR